MTGVKKELNEQTSKEVAAIAARLLRDPNTPADVKRVCASALTQARHKSEAEKAALLEAKAKKVKSESNNID